MILGKTKESYFTILLLALIVSCSSPSTAEEDSLFNDNDLVAELESVQLSIEEQDLFDIVNDHRVSNGLNPVTYSGETYVFAQEHNEYMISKGKLSHDNLDERASQIAKQTSADSVEENVARNFQNNSETLEAWLASEDHKNTIEGDFTHATLSITRDDQGMPYYTQIFFRK